MPTPNATLLASVNGGAPTTGGITAAAGDTVQFSFLNTTGWRSNCRLELSFPSGFSLPSGWSSETVDGHTVYYVLGNTTPPPITLGPWGKYMTRLIVNGGVATDEATAISVPSPGGLLDLGHREAGQFGGSAEKWAKDQRANLRVIQAGLGGGSGVVAATPDTLLLRGSAGEGRVTRIETPIVRTATSGDIELQHGTTTFARLRSTSACSQPGDLRFDATTGDLLVYFNGGETSAFEHKVRWHKTTADTSDSAATPEFILFEAPCYDWTITSVTFTPDNNLAANASNYATLRVRIVEPGGTTVGYAATGVTTPSGANSTGGWVPYTPVSLTLDSGLLSFPIYSTHCATFTIYKSASGVTVPSGVLRMTVVPWRS